jgi:hypothetical protein
LRFYLIDRCLFFHGRKGITAAQTRARRFRREADEISAKTLQLLFPAVISPHFHGMPGSISISKLLFASSNFAR